MLEKKKTAAMDGNEAAAHVAYAFTEIAAIYPITPSSPMAEKTDEWSALGRKNIFGQTVKLVEMQSEAGAIGAVHGAVETGALATSYTSAQGLMLMIPTMYRIAGTRQPAVLHVASRTVGTHAMSIFGDHSDVMSCRSTGFAFLSSGSVQEVMHIGAVAHLAAIKGRTPFLHFFDGFRTSHEIQKINCPGYDELAKLVDKKALDEFRNNSLNPEHPTLRNTVQNPDIYFQVREASNRFYDALPGIVDEYMQAINKITGSDYGLFNYYGDPGATRVIVAMGSVSGTIRDTVDHLNASGEKVGYLQVHLYRPFSLKHFFAALPSSVSKIAVLDRCKEHGALGEPLFQDVCQAYVYEKKRPLIVGGRYGLSSKDTDPAQIKAVFDNLNESEPKNNFTIGINDDVTGLSLAVDKSFTISDPGIVCCKLWGLASDGTVGANKNSIKIIGDHTDMYTQGYFEFDTKKSYGVTKSHLRFGSKPVRSTHLVKWADFVACHNQTFLHKYDMITELKPGGTFLLNCSFSEDELSEKLPGEVKRYIAENNINFYITDAASAAQSLGLGGHFNMILQASFFKLANIIKYDEAVRYMKGAVYETYGKKGEDIIKMNLAAIDAGTDSLRKVKVPSSWLKAKPGVKKQEKKLPPVIKDILIPINSLKGDDLPVSSFEEYLDGTMPPGTSAYEKRDIATELPDWDADACIQCNLCSYVCPHSVIRPYLLDESEAALAPPGFVQRKAIGSKASGYSFSLQTSALDCTSCGCCVTACPVKGKAIKLKPKDQVKYDGACWEYGLTITEKSDVFPVSTVKGSQFKQPLLEFSGACAGCGETPYAKLMTQLFGDRVYWANATGCSQAWGAAMPCVPYTKNKQGKGPAWSNSLFENNAEFSLGMCLSVNQQREGLKQKALELKELSPGGDAAAALSAWLDNYDDAEASKSTSPALVLALSKAKLSGRGKSLASDIIKRKDQLTKKTFWMYGGDGWAYDIGYGGLDHVVATGADVNVLVVDTEVYSNTGGQSSKATPLGAAAQFQAAGKNSRKKDLGKLLMTYGNVYVAQVAMGADPAQCLKALREADSYPGPAVIIAYASCIAHGIKTGMGNAQDEMRLAVESGYWHLYRYNPLNVKQPFTLDSKEPTMPFYDFIKGETRYSSLEIAFPENAKTLFAQAEKDAKEKYLEYKSMHDGKGII